MPRRRSDRAKARQSWFFAECVCGEITPTAIIQKDDGFICANCDAREKGEPERVCLNCRKSAPFEGHHAKGWKVSPKEIEDWCINCHRKRHRGRAI
jgi:hypothetical protein